MKHNNPYQVIKQRYITEKAAPIKLHQTNLQVVEEVEENLRRLKKERDKDEVESALTRLKGAAEGNENLMPFVLEAVKAYATVGEICRALVPVFGLYREVSVI